MADNTGNKKALKNLIEIFKNRNRSFNNADKAPKIVMVTGAGASLWSGMPLWPELYKPLMEAIETKVPSFCHEAWDQLASIIGHSSKKNEDGKEDLEKRVIETNSLEQLLAVACRYSTVHHAVRQTLCKKFRVSEDASKDIGLAPQLGYELLAHLLKHGMVDHIITFNFDELLDRAIDSELHAEEYSHIFTEHMIGDERARKPTLINIHGRISVPKTMRFTLPDTNVLSSEMRGLLDDIIFGDTRPVHIITLGYGWKDADFARWISSNLKSIATLTSVQAGMEIPKLLSANLNSIEQTPPVFLVDMNRITDRPFYVDELIGAVCNTLKDDIPSIARHLVLSHAFHPVPKNRGKDSHKHTLANRMRLEFILHLLKCKGMVCTSVMAEDTRLNRFFQSISPQDDPLRDTNLVTAQNHADIPEVYLLAEKFGTKKEHAIENLSEDRVFSTLRSQKEISIPRIEDGKVEFCKQTGKKFLKRNLTDIFEGEEIEVDRRREPKDKYIFRSSESLRTSADLKECTLRILENAHYLFVIAETGAWLEKQKVLTPNVFLITSSQDALEQWYIRPKITLPNNVHTAQIPWWRHNRHLSIAFGKNGKLKGGIFFRRPLKASRVSPIFLDDDDDGYQLLLTFLAYTSRALKEVGDEKNITFTGELIQVVPKLVKKKSTANHNSTTKRRIIKLIASLKEQITMK